VAKRFRLVALAAACFLLPSALPACYWDYDTLQMERSRFPDTLELITGKFLRHSYEFYEWRVQDRLKKIEGDPSNPAFYDDLAVAYDKLGQHQKAIDTILAKDRLRPGLYETEANLGTFLLHEGSFEEGLRHINKALEINPDAHFGREKYQKALAEYVLSRRQDGPLKLPVAKVELTVINGTALVEGQAHETFNDFLRLDKQQPLSPGERAAAIKGVLGMMKFSNHTSPILLEVLGTLLHNDELDVREEDGKRLAARAFLKASYDAPDETARDAYLALARYALYWQIAEAHSSQQISLEQVEADFKGELAEADKWYADLREKELSWIHDGKDPEAEFNRLYAEEPRVTSPPEPADPRPSGLVRGAIFTGCLLVVVGCVVFALRRDARKARVRP
jgi:tetratricopeptide (TPR) repeat protein